MPNNSNRGCPRCNAASSLGFRQALFTVQLAIYLGLPAAGFIAQIAGVWTWNDYWQNVWLVSVCASLASQGVLRLPQVLEAATKLASALAALKAGVPPPEEEEHHEG